MHMSVGRRVSDPQQPDDYWVPLSRAGDRNGCCQATNIGSVQNQYPSLQGPQLWHHSTCALLCRNRCTIAIWQLSVARCRTLTAVARPAASETSIMRPIAVFAMPAEPSPRDQTSILQQQRQAWQLLDTVGEFAFSGPALVKYATCTPTDSQLCRTCVSIATTASNVSISPAGSSPLSVLSIRLCSKPKPGGHQSLLSYRTAMTSAAPPTTYACATPAIGE